MRIKLVSIKDFMRLKEVKIFPEGRNVILIAGMNKVGKSSLMGAFSACLGGKGETPERPIRDEEDFAEIKIDLEDDSGVLGYEVTRRFLKNGKSSLRVEGRDGKLSSPQKILDRIIGKRFLDPVLFLSQPPKAQFDSLLEFMDIGIDLSQWAKMRKETFDSRTSVNRDIKRYRLEVASNPHPGKIPDLPDENIAERVSKLNEAKDKRRAAEHLVSGLRSKYEDQSDTIERMESRLKIERDTLDDIKAAGTAAKITLESFPDVSEDLSKAMNELRSSSERHSERNAKISQAERNEKAKLSLGEVEKESEELTEVISTMDKDKADRLAGAKMPVSGLEIDDDKILYKGVPLSQASGAEQLHISLSIAAAMSPELSDIWIEDGARFDLNSLAQMGKFAEDNNLCLWVERVGESDDGAIIFEDGEVRDK